ncbi:hypothetical protein LTR08_008558 [Meristemomyces frigidus]|nr:hypothetical protein LTR08_008558 [Meristemomyces frigidus]
MATPTAEQSRPAPTQAGKAASTNSSQPEEYTIVHTAPRRKAKKAAAYEDEQPLNDTTEALAKNSKKLARLQKKQHKKQGKESTRVRNFLELPAELLHEILSHLRPTDVARVSRLNHATRDFILQNETSIARDIMDRRFYLLRQSLPLPVAFEEVDEDSRPALLNPLWQERTAINQRLYTHIQPLNAQQVCSCLSCIQAWNNLNVVLDFAHFQWHLNNREPISMVARGAVPEWNLELTDSHARLVKQAMTSQLCYAGILEKHLNSITGTLLRQVRFPPKVPMHRHNKPAYAIPEKTLQPVRPYQVTEVDAATEDDLFLEREGRHSYEMPFHRDNYYSLLAYVPNRKWSKEEQRWICYAAGAHERDLAWVRDRFMPTTSAESVIEKSRVKPVSTLASPKAAATSLYTARNTILQASENENK